MEENKKKRLGEILIEDGVLNREALEEALTYQKSHGGLIGQILIKLGYLSEEQVVAALTTQLNIPYLPLANYSLNMDAAKLFDEELCRRNTWIAFDVDEKRVYVALADPLNETIIHDIESKSKLKVNVYISTTTEIANMLDLVFHPSNSNPKTSHGR